jgi:hypothetical protein
LSNSRTLDKPVTWPSAAKRDAWNYEVIGKNGIRKIVEDLENSSLNDLENLGFIRINNTVLFIENAGYDYLERNR